MSDDKPFPATATRLRKARREGDIPQSHELNVVAAFLGGGLCAVAAAPPALSLAAAWLLRAARGEDARGTAAALAVMALAPACAAAASGAAAALVQSGGIASRPLKFDPAKLALDQGFKRMFSRISAVAALRAVLAFAVCAVVLGPIMRDALTLGYAVDGPQALAALARASALRMLFSALAVGAAFALADLFLQRAQWLKRMRMSFDEVKHDYREQNGDPHQRLRRKELHKARAREALQHVRGASFVVANPTHLAIALRYDPPAVAVPRVLVRAADDAALRVRAIAEEHGIPIVENVSVARALYAATLPGNPVPPELYVAVAEIVAALMREGQLA